MKPRIQIRVLKPDEPTPEDVLGQTCTLELPKNLPNLQQTALCFKAFHENADLLVNLLRCGITLFPTGVNFHNQNPDEPPSAP